MSFKFMHNYVSTATKNVPTLSDIMKKAQTSQKLSETKTASSSKAVKTAGELPDFIKEKIEKSKGKKDDDSEGDEPEDKKDDKKDDKKEASTKATKKVAESEEAESSGQLEEKANPTNEPKVEDKPKSTGGKSKSGDEAESSGQLDVEPLHQKGESTGEKPSGLDTQKGKKEAAGRGRFVRVASLTSKQKDFLRRVWSTYWPKSFIDAFLARV